MPESILPSTLRENASDTGAAFLRVITAAVGGPAGAVFGEIIAHVLPNQRQQRIVSYLAATATRLNATQEEVAKLVADMAGVKGHLFEVGAAAATSATSDDRIEQIAHVVSAGLNSDEQGAADSVRFLALLQDVSDDDVVMLCVYAPSFHRAEEWFRKHPRALAIRSQDATDQPDSNYLPGDLSEDERDQELMMNFQRDRLVRMGLLTAKSEPLPDHRRGMMRDVRTHTLSPLGRLLLRRLGVARPT